MIDLTIEQQRLFFDLEKREPNQYSVIKASFLSDNLLQRRFAQEVIEELLSVKESVSVPRFNLKLSTVVAIKKNPKLVFTPKEKSIIDKIKIAADEMKIKVYLAGGIIRDRLLGLKSHDLDFVVDKNVEGLVRHIMKKFNIQNAIRYDRSQAISITIDGLPIDLINAERILRPIKADIPLEGTEEFTVSLDDVYRRDLTINSLLYDIQENELVDFTGQGLKDLKEKRIRTIIDPQIKYKIHAADMLRALRFAVMFNFIIDDETKEAMQINAFRLKPRDRGGDISNRRIRRELRKTLDTPEHWERMKVLLAEVGLFDILKDDIEDVEADLHGNIEYTY